MSILSLILIRTIRLYFFCSDNNRYMYSRQNNDAAGMDFQVAADNCIPSDQLIECDRLLMIKDKINLHDKTHNKQQIHYIIEYIYIASICKTLQNSQLLRNCVCGNSKQTCDRTQMKIALIKS